MRSLLPYLWSEPLEETLGARSRTIPVKQIEHGGIDQALVLRVRRQAQLVTINLQPGHLSQLDEHSAPNRVNQDELAVADPVATGPTPHHRQDVTKAPPTTDEPSSRSHRQSGTENNRFRRPRRPQSSPGQQRHQDHADSRQGARRQGQHNLGPTDHAAWMVPHKIAQTHQSVQTAGSAGSSPRGPSRQRSNVGEILHRLGARHDSPATHRPRQDRRAAGAMRIERAGHGEEASHGGASSVGVSSSTSSKATF